jgi:general secretion pathway protein G
MRRIAPDCGKGNDGHRVRRSFQRRNHSQVVAGPLTAMTLVEILAVVVILGLVAGTLLMGFSGAFGKAKHELAKSGIGVIVSKIELYKIEVGHWPDNDLGLAALSDGHAVPTVSYYLSHDKLTDPWGKPYLYITPGPSGHPFEVITYGADGQPGGESGSEDADLSSVNLRDDKHQ